MLWEGTLLIKTIPLKLSQSLCVLGMAEMELIFPTGTLAFLCTGERKVL